MEIEFISAQSLAKTGISAGLAGDFPEIFPRVAASWTLETEAKSTNTPILQGFLSLLYHYL
jgi:hypothetical protein